MVKRTIAGRRRLDNETSRWLIVLLILGGALGVYGIQRWNGSSDAPIAGVAYVIDGDTISIAGRHIRLVDIDAPELHQNCADADGASWPCGQIASRDLRHHLRGQNLSCKPQAYDQYHRALAVCTLPDGTDVNAWIVQQGLAVTSGFAKVYGTQEREARSARRGIWVGTFTEPREWRRQHPRSPTEDRKG